MSFFADRAERHRAGREALYDFFGGLDFFDRKLACRSSSASSSRARVQRLALWLSMRSVYSWKVLKLSCRTACCSLLIVKRIEQVIFAIDALVIVSADRQFSLELGQWAEGIFMF